VASPLTKKAPLFYSGAFFVCDGARDFFAGIGEA